LISLSSKFAYSFPINFVEIESDPNPTSWTNICRYEEAFRIFSNQSSLFVESRLADEPDHSIAMMIELVVGKYFLPNLESDVAIPNLFVRDLRQFLADLNYSLSPAL